jgi:hypothetical protein
MSKWNKLIDNRFANGSTMNDEFIARMKECFNACTQFDTPETDIPKLIEALNKANEDINWMINNQQFLNPGVTTYIDEALALVKE